MPKVLPEYKEEAKKRIIEASVKVMSEKGYSQTTMEDIAAYLGVSKGALYLYFKSKDDIIVESAKKMQSHLLQLRMMQMTASPTKDPLDVWIKILDNFMPFDSKINTLYFELVAITQRDPEINKLSAKNLEKEIEMIEHEIALQQQMKLVRTDADPRTIAVALISFFSGLRLMNILGLDRDEIRKRWAEMGRIMLGIKD
ncbi:MAG: TetR/AcrR family transcriptional regulator [Methanothrix sp.]|jgi:AcrR family transcriptional regulator|nr:TetR/AcrR family transcriptional regulator [Methanothrix soehngenii]